MTSLMRYPDLQLPWSSSKEQDKFFAVCVAVAVVIILVAGVIIQQYQLPERSREELAKLPPQLAKVVLQKKVELPPPPKVEEKKPEVKPEPKKEEPKPVEEKKPEPPKTKTQAKPEEVEKAREKAKQSGVLAMQDDLAALRQSFSVPTANTGKLSSGGSTATEVKRSVIMGSATSTSGGIKTAAVPTSSGVAGIAAGPGGRGATQVDSVTLGGTQVDVGKDMEKATQRTADGQRSEEKIRAVLDQNKGALYAIYNRALRSNPSLQGRVTFELVIEPNGAVSSVKIVSSQLKDPELENRLVARMKMISFGAEKVSSIKTRWAIDFLPY